MKNVNLTITQKKEVVNLFYQKLKNDNLKNWNKSAYINESKPEYNVLLNQLVTLCEDFWGGSDFIDKKDNDRVIYLSDFKKNHSAEIWNEIFPFRNRGKDMREKKESLSIDKNGELKKLIFKKKSLKNLSDRVILLPIHKRVIAWYFEYYTWDDFISDFLKGKNLKRFAELAIAKQPSNEIIEKDTEATAHLKLQALLKKKSDDKVEKLMISIRESLLSQKDPLINESLEKILNRPLLDDKEGLSKRFKSVINSVKLKPELCIELSRYFDSPFNWYHRCVLASALCLSVLKGWDKNKIRLLQRLIVNHEEPLINRIATFGILLSFMISHNKQSKFEFNDTIRLLEELKGNSEFGINLFSALKSLLKILNESDMSIAEPPTELSEDEVFAIKGFQVFEPYHSNSSYLSQITELNFSSKQQEEDFYLLINESLAFSFYQKLDILIQLHDKSELIIHDITYHLEEEKRALYKINVSDSVDHRKVVKYQYEHLMIDFLSKIGPKYIGEISTAIKSLNNSNFALELAIYFPCYDYLSFLPLYQIISNISYNVDAYTNVGFDLLEQGRIEDATEIFNKGLVLDDQSKNAIIGLSIVHLETKNYNLVIEYCNRLIKIEPFNELSLLRLAYSYEQILDFSEAINTYKKLIHLDKENEVAFSSLGKIFANRNQYDDAIIAYQKALELDPIEEFYHFNLGRLFLKKENYVKAKDFFLTAITLKDNEPNFYFYLGVTLKHLNENENALVSYNKGIQLDSNNSKLWEYKAESLYELGLIKEAIEALSMVTRLDPANNAARRNLISLLLSQGRVKKAMKVLEKNNQLQVYDFNFLTTIQELFLNKNLYEEAVKISNELIAIEPENENVWIQKGILLHKLERNNEAIGAFNHTIGINPQNFKAIYNKGVALKTNGEFEEAWQCFESAVELAPLESNAWFTMGLMNFEISNFEKAKTFLFKSLELLATKEAYYYIGQCEFMLSTTEIAIEYFQKSLDLWDCSKEFFEGFDDDYKYLKGVKKETYQKIKKQLENYFKRRKPKHEDPEN